MTVTLGLGQLIGLLVGGTTVITAIMSFAWWVISGRITLAIREVEANVAQKMAETVQGVQTLVTSSTREVTRSIGDVDAKLRETVQTVQATVGTVQASLNEATTAMRVQAASFQAERKGDVGLVNAVCGRLRTDLDECRRDVRSLQRAVGSGKVFDAADPE